VCVQKSFDLVPSARAARAHTLPAAAVPSLCSLHVLVLQLRSSAQSLAARAAAAALAKDGGARASIESVAAGPPSDRATAARMMTCPHLVGAVTSEQYRLGLTKIFFQASRGRRYAR
jgi:hypothetical protein